LKVGELMMTNYWQQRSV